MEKNIVNITKTQNFHVFILDYPQSIHNLHEDYLLSTLETVVIDESMLSDKQKLLLTDKDGNLQFIQPPPKLFPNLRNKRNYVHHYKSLKQYVSHGLILEKLIIICVLWIVMGLFIKVLKNRNPLLREIMIARLLGLQFSGYRI